jgi:aerobic-type carbon monoxide dehydrogenase small subunit (CoxS/CutS family)
LCDRPGRPSRLEIEEAISGNICRCTGYGRILDAIDRALDAR